MVKLLYVVHETQSFWGSCTTHRPSEKPHKNGSFSGVPFIGTHLADILSIQEMRTVGNDNTVRYDGRILQIPQDTHRCHYVKASVRVHEYPDGILAIFHGPRCLARYDSAGKQLRPKRKAAA
jgi:hypothetical protein